MCDTLNILEPYTSDYIRIDNWCEIHELALLEHQIALGDIIAQCDANMLIFHGLGSGKTCTSIVMMEVLKRSLVNRDQLEILIVCPASIQKQYVDEFRVCPIQSQNVYTVEIPHLLDMYRHLDRELDREEAVEFRALERTYQNAKVSTLLRHDIRVLSYDKLLQPNTIKELMNNGKQKIIFVDEIQNLISETSEQYKNFETLIHSLSKNRQTGGRLLSRLFVLTATPIVNYPNDLSLILRLLDINNPNIKITRDLFLESYTQNPNALKKMIKSHVSYVSGGHPSAFPFKRIIVREYPMSIEQMEKYRTTFANLIVKYREEHALLQDMDNLNSDKMPPEQRKMMQLCVSSRNVHDINIPELEHFSPKIYHVVNDILNNVYTNEGTVFVFANQIKGCLDILVMALEYYGYRQWTADAPEDGKNFFLWTGETDKAVADTVRESVFNTRENIHGRRLKIMIGSSTISEGITFKNVSTIHILDTWWNNALIRQVIARCVRFKSHCAVHDPQASTIPTVNIYRHVSVFPPDMIPLSPNKGITSWMSMEEYMIYMSSKKQIANNHFESLLKQTAIDCTAFKNGNLYRLEERLVPIRSKENPFQYYRYYQNPLNSKKYVIKNAEFRLDYTNIDYSPFQKFPIDTVFTEIVIDNDGKTFRPTDTELRVGDSLTETLIGYENIACQNT
uniref:Helicase ATP-binding domain-containing protein n=1 Tax=viral metagenome TaxID=1070528 RepID=A0A6C0CT72_9ZZZZ